MQLSKLPFFLVSSPHAYTLKNHLGGCGENALAKNTEKFYLRKMKSYRLDRTAFAIQSFEEAANQRDYWLARTPQERLAAAWYLICSAYNLDRTNLHRLDRTAFAIRKQPA